MLTITPGIAPTHILLNFKCDRIEIAFINNQPTSKLVPSMVTVAGGRGLWTCAHPEPGQGWTGAHWHHQELHPAGVAGLGVLPCGPGMETELLACWGVF